MARKQEPAGRFGELRPQYERSLEQYMLKAGMLATTVSTVLALDARAKEIGAQPMEATFRERLERALSDFEAAQ